MPESTSPASTLTEVATENASPKFGIGQIFALMFLLNVIVYSGTRFGFLDQEFRLSVLLTTLASMLIVVAFQHGKSILAISLVVGSCLMAMKLKLFPLFVGPVIIGIVGWVMCRKKMSAMQLVNFSILGTASGLLLQVAIPNEPADPYLRHLRENSPIESLSERLAYESNAKHRPIGIFSADVMENLKRQEQMIDRLQPKEKTNFYDRPTLFQNLQTAHKQEIKRFHEAQGFGYSRMVAVDWIADQAEKEPPRFDSPGFAFNHSSTRNENIVERLAGVSNGAWSTENFHQLSQLDFLNPSFGWAKSKHHVAGFRPHGFSDFDAKFRNGPEIWRLKQLQLISLDRFPNPRAYVLDHMPRMEELSEDVPETRILNVFERESLDRLHHEADVIVDPNGEKNKIRMMGAIRAVANCLPCHDQVQRGELLGAFTYHFELQE